MYTGKYEDSSQSRTNRPRPSSGSPRPPRKRRRKKKIGAIVFYSILLAFIILFCIALSIVMKRINNWLVKFEASQPTAKCEAVFTDLFQDPDWQRIYNLSDDEGHITAADYEKYMIDKFGDQELNYIETSAGLSGDKKYIVRCGSVKVATFTLCNEAPDADIPQWELGDVDIFYSAKLSVTVMAPPDYSVFINGNPLDESYIIRTTATKAEDLLPDQVHGYRLNEMVVHDLLIEPEIEILDPQGNPVEAEYDSQTQCYKVEIGSPEITDEHRQTLVDTAETYCKYMIGDANRSALRNYFDSNSAIYKTITENTTWMQSYSSYKLDPAEITDYYRYNDEYYSARVSLSMKVTRKNGTVKEYNLDSTFFLKKTDDQWLAWDMINTNPQEQIINVLLTYVSQDQVVHTEMVDANSNKLVLPEITVPEGKTFMGWFTKTVNEEGTTVTELAFEPSEDNTVRLSDDSVLEPMTLYALYQ